MLAMSLNVDTSLNGRLTQGDGLMLQFAEHFDEFIVDHQMESPTIFQRIPYGVFKLFNGLDAKTNIYRGTLGPQSGLTNWTAISPTKKSVVGTPGFELCSYRPQTYTWGVDTVTFGGYRSSWTSPVFDICALKFVDYAKEQLAMIVASGSRVVDDSKEVFARENWVKAAVDGGKAFILAPGATDYDVTSLRFSYNPYSSTEITFPSSVLSRISTLNWTFLDQFRQYLSDQAPDAALSNAGGDLIYGLMIDTDDIERMVRADPELHEDFRYAMPQQLISGFNLGLKVYRRFALIPDRRQMRYTIKSNNGTTVTLTRVEPRRATRQGTIGYIPETNPDYLLAPLAIGVIFMNKVIQILVPENVTNLGSGLVFGPSPGFNGEWKWINEYHPTDNPLHEVGHFFARFENYVKPLIYSNEATVFLYRRCTQTLQTGCLAEAQDSVAGSTEHVGVAANAVTGDVDATNYTLTVTLAKLLPGGVGAAVTTVADNATSLAAVISDDSQAPKYTFVATSAFQAYTQWTAAGSSYVVMA
jgi:hypothetical protein